MRFFPYGKAETEHLKRRDATLGEAMDRLGRVEREVTPDPFQALLRSVVAQQISAKAAATVWTRIREMLGEVTPARVAEAGAEALKRCGLSLRKASRIHAIGRAAARGEVDFEGLRALNDAEVVARLTALPGVGAWTAEMLLIHCLERPDVVSRGDLAIRRGMMRLYRLDSLPRTVFDEFARRYSPHGSVASIYLWRLSAED
ncbi:MAG: DNA-3-methyladenine glycosylase family protein [Thermodesulfobacteriota bacterium]